MAAEEPVPVKATARGEFAALLTTVAVPVSVAAVVGVKSTPNDAVCPAASVRGSEMVVGLNPVPVIPILEMVTLELPVLERVTVFVDEVPSVTLPKLRAAGEADS